jgi:hypothetical protein
VGTTPRPPRREGVYRYSVAYFLAALVALLLTVPLVDEFIAGELVESVLITVVLLSAVVAVGGRRRSLIAGLALVAPAVVAKWINHLWPHLIPPAVSQVTAVVFLAFVTFRLGHFILTAPRVDSEVLCAAISVYLIFGLMWGFLYVLVAGINPKAFAFTVSPDANPGMARFPALYFSFITLTTVGYGDIVPLSKAARVLAAAEAIAGVFFPAIVIARLVALYSTTKPAHTDDGRTP